jgi:twinkle protein
MTELNGFKIKNYNQYGFKANVKTSTCPICSEERKKKTDKCVMLDWERGLATCQHCGVVLQMHEYIKSNQEIEYVKPPQKINDLLSEKVVNWFAGRGIGLDTIRRLRISGGLEWMPQTKTEVMTIQFNYFLDSSLVNVKYRDAAKNFKMFKDAEKIFYNIDSIRFTDEVVITEGEVDVCSLVESGVYNSISVPNGFNLNGNINLDYLTNYYELFENKSKIILCLDNDEPGRKGQQELIRRFGAEKCYLVDLGDCKDANEYLIKYSAEKLAEAVKSAPQCPLENVLTAADVAKELENFYLNGHQKGYSIGLPQFDNIFTTYTKQFIVVTGFPSSGKSDFVDQMCVGYNIQHGWKTAYASTENFPAYLHVDKVVRKFYGLRPDSTQVTDLEWKKTVQHVSQNFFHINYDDGYDLVKVLSKAEELVKRKGIRVLVIDPYNKVRYKEKISLSINDYTNSYLNLIDTFCKKHDVLVILVAHPNKPEKINGELQPPTFYDVKGGGEFYDMSPHGLLVHRERKDDDNPGNLVTIKVLKVKFANLGVNDASCQFGWNVNNGRYDKVIGGDTIWDNSNWLSKGNKFSQNQLSLKNLDNLADVF